MRAKNSEEEEEGNCRHFADDSHRTWRVLQPALAGLSLVSGVLHRKLHADTLLRSSIAIFHACFYGLTHIHRFCHTRAHGGVWSAFCRANPVPQLAGSGRQ